MAPPRRSKPRTPELEALSSAVQERMDELGMNQRELAEASGLDGRRISDYVRGRFNPNYEHLKMLCDGLRMTSDELRKRAEKIEAELAKGGQ